MLRRTPKAAVSKHARPQAERLRNDKAGPKGPATSLSIVDFRELPIHRALEGAGLGDDVPDDV